MLICMALGELVVRADLFGGFLYKPSVWLGVILEMIFWLACSLPIVLVTMNIARRLPNPWAIRLALGVWPFLGGVIVLTYWLSFGGKSLSFEFFTRADVAFGWTIPCALILVFYSAISRDYLKATGVK